MNRFENVAAVGSLMDRLDEALDMRCKRLESRPLDRDRAVEMRSSPFHQSRYNSLNLSACTDVIQWTVSSPDRRAMFDAPFDPTLHDWPRHLHI